MGGHADIMRGIGRRASPWLVALLAAGCASEQPSTYAGFIDAPVAAVAVQTSGRVASVEVREGDRVRSNQLLARLESRERAAMVRQAEAEVQRATNGLTEAQRNVGAVQPTVAGAEADIARARAELRNAQLEFDRVQRLESSGAATTSELDAARARLQEAQATVASMEAGRSATRGRLGATSAAVATAEAAVTASHAALELAQAQLAQTEVHSPFVEGLVVEQNLQVGEWAAPGTPVLTVEDLSRQWARIDVEETEIGRLRLGQPARIRVIAFPGRTWAGHVIEIGAEGEFALNRDVRRGRPDIRTFRVRVALDRIAEELRPGMTAEVELLGVARR